MKNKLLVLIFLMPLMSFFYLSCSKEADPVEIKTLYPNFINGIPFYYGTFDVTTSFGISFKGRLGGAARSSRLVNSATLCDSNTFVFVVNVTNLPEEDVLAFPQAVRSLSINDIPFEVGKHKLIDVAYQDKKNCAIDTFPRISFFVSDFDGEDLVALAEYELDKSASNYIEITRMDTLKNDIAGNFQATFINRFTKKDKDVPDTAFIKCVDFKIPWGKKR